MEGVRQGVRDARLTTRPGTLTIGKDNVDHADEHPVLGRVTGVLDDGDNVGPLLGHVDEITTTSVRELDGVDGSLGSDNVGDVGYRGTAEVMQGKGWVVHQPREGGFMFERT